MCKKIAFQISFVVAIIMLLFQLLSSIMLARSIKNTYTGTKEELYGRDLKAVQLSINEDYPSPEIFLYYEDHLAEIKEKVDWDDADFTKLDYVSSAGLRILNISMQSIKEGGETLLKGLTKIF